MPTRFVVQPEMRGQAQAVALTRGLVDGDALVMFADTIFEADFTPLQALRAQGIDGAIYVKEIDDPPCRNCTHTGRIVQAFQPVAKALLLFGRGEKKKLATEQVGF